MQTLAGWLACACVGLRKDILFLPSQTRHDAVRSVWMIFLALVLAHGEALSTQPLPLRISGEWVDVSGYASKHKGGRWVLDYARGKDCTFLFHAIHVFNKDKAARALASLPRIETLEKNPLVFEFPIATASKERQALDSEFRDELHDMVRRRFDGDSAATKATNAHMARIAVLFGLTASCWAGWAQGDVIATFFLPFAHWLLAAHTCHDATHGSLSSNPAVNYALQFTAHPLYFNVFVWIPQHLLSHHQFTNELDDVDIHHFAPCVLSTHIDDSEQSNPWTFVLKGCLTTLGTCILQPMRTVFDLNTPNFEENITPVSECVSKTTVALSMLPSLAVLLWPMLSHPDHLAFIEIWPWVASSLIWTSMTQTSHIQGQCQQTENNAACWTAQQIASSLDYSIHDKRTHAVVSALTGGLNAQALHHALPTISQCHLPEIYEEYVEICEKHNVRRSTSPNLATATTEMLDFVFSESDRRKQKSSLVV